VKYEGNYPTSTTPKEQKTEHDNAKGSQELKPEEGHGVLYCLFHVEDIGDCSRWHQNGLPLHLLRQEVGQLSAETTWEEFHQRSVMSKTIPWVEATERRFELERE
jgi:hypothetical protein